MLQLIQNTRDKQRKWVHTHDHSRQSKVSITVGKGLFLKLNAFFTE